LDAIRHAHARRFFSSSVGPQLPVGRFRIHPIHRAARK